jgi:hypothetical protein
MDINLVQEELIKRYLYLYDNKELILALCISYGIEEKYYKKEIKKVTELLYSIEAEKGHSELKTTQVEMLSSLLEDLNEGLREPKLYLFAKVNDEIVSAYEEFLFTDQKIEDTVLYKHIEALKNNPIFLESVQDSINGLEERRQKNMHLKRIPTFTVWKILTYVKNKNKNNSVVLEALEKYYNIDRYMLTGIDWKSGYKLLPTDYESGEKLSVFPNSRLIGESNIGGQYSAVICNYPGNEFEEEDDYSAFDWSLEFEEQPLNNYSKTNFMAALKDMPMLSEELKIEIYKKLKSSSKKMTKNL